MSINLIDREEIEKLIKKGYTVRRICDYYKERGIDVKYDGMYNLIKEEMNCEKNVEPKVSTREIAELRRKGFSYSEIAKILTEQGKNISSQEVYIQLEKLNNVLKKNCLPEERTDLEKVNILTEEDKFELDKILQDEIIFRGTTISNWCRITKNEYLKNCLIERVNKIRIIANHSKKVNDEFVEDKSLLEVLKIVENPKMEEPYKKYNVYLKGHIDKNDVIENGKIDILIKQVFKNNTDLMVYILEGYQPKFIKEEYTNEERYDERVYNQKKADFKNKVSNYFRILEQVENMERSREKVRKQIRTVEGQEDER